jgi:hypothetical protein
MLVRFSDILGGLWILRLAVSCGGVWGGNAIKAPRVPEVYEIVG